jgi:hypothetical protein
VEGVVAIFDLFLVNSWGGLELVPCFVSFVSFVKTCHPAKLCPSGDVVQQSAGQLASHLQFDPAAGPVAASNNTVASRQHKKDPLPASPFGVQSPKHSARGLSTGAKNRQGQPWSAFVVRTGSRFHWTQMASRTDNQAAQPPTAPRLLSRLSHVSKRSARSSSFEADDELSSTATLDDLDFSGRNSSGDSPTSNMSHSRQHRRSGSGRNGGYGGTTSDDDDGYDYGNGTALPSPRYPGDDTRPTSSKELAGWYAYAFAAEVYVVCGTFPIRPDDASLVAFKSSPLPNANGRNLQRLVCAHHLLDLRSIRAMQRRPEN